MAKVKILMVCLGNICRSPLAEGILQSKLSPENFTVDSAGTASYHIGKLPDPRSIAVAKKNNIDITHQRCRQFTKMILMSLTIYMLWMLVITKIL